MQRNLYWMHGLKENIRDNSDETQTYIESLCPASIRVVLMQTVDFWFQTHMMMQGHTPNGRRMLCWEVYIFLYQDWLKKKNWYAGAQLTLKQSKIIWSTLRNILKKEGSRKEKQEVIGTTRLVCFLTVIKNIMMVCVAMPLCFLSRSTKMKRGNSGRRWGWRRGQGGGSRGDSGCYVCGKAVGLWLPMEEWRSQSNMGEREGGEL